MLKIQGEQIMQIYDRDRNKIWVDAPFPQILSL